MARFLLHENTHRSRRPAVFLLALAFLSGLLVGCVIQLSAEFDSLSWMRGMADAPVTIVGLLSVVFLPFLFSAFAVYASQRWLLFPIAFCKALSFALAACGISIAYGSAGWLMRFLLMFTDILSLPLLAFFWLRYSGGGRRLSLYSVFTYFAAAACIGSIDFFVISPFLAGL